MHKRSICFNDPHAPLPRSSTLQEWPLESAGSEAPASAAAKDPRDEGGPAAASTPLAPGGASRSRAPRLTPDAALREVLRGAAELLTPPQGGASGGRGGGGTPEASRGRFGSITPLVLSSAEASRATVEGEESGDDEHAREGRARGGDGDGGAAGAAFLAEEAEHSREFDSQLEAHMSRLRAALELSLHSGGGDVGGDVRGRVE